MKDFVLIKELKAKRRRLKQRMYKEHSSYVENDMMLSVIDTKIHEEMMK